MPKNLKRAILSCAGCTLMLFVTCGLAFNVFSAAQPYILTQILIKFTDCTFTFLDI